MDRRRKRHSAVALLVLAAACGKQSSSAGGGSVVVGRLRGVVAEARGTALFQSPGASVLDPFTPGLQANDPLTLAPGGCGDVSTAADSSLRLPLDAGPALHVSQTGGGYDLTRSGGAYLGTAGVALYGAGSTVTVSGPGGTDLPSFSVPLAAPSDFTLLAPDLSGGLIKVAQTSSLSLSWTAGGASDSLFVEALQGDGVTATARVCRFPDTGSALIGTAFWMAFQPSASVPDLNASLIVYRETRTSANAGSTPLSLFVVDQLPSRLDLH